MARVPRNLGFSFFGWQPSPYFRVCKPSPPSQPWAQRRLAPYFRQTTVALHPAHPHNLGLPMGLSDVSLVKDAWPLAPWVMALNPAHPGNLGSLGAPFLQLHVARLCPLEPTLATLPPHDAGHNCFFSLGFRAPRNLPTLPSGSSPTVPPK